MFFFFDRRGFARGVKSANMKLEVESVYTLAVWLEKTASHPLDIYAPRICIAKSEK